jgi:hypothetical protein
MANLEYLAAAFKFSASTDGSAWSEIGGINTWGYNEEMVTVETTDFDDVGGASSTSSRCRAISSPTPPPEGGTPARSSWRSRRGPSARPGTSR